MLTDDHPQESMIGVRDTCARSQPQVMERTPGRPNHEFDITIGLIDWLIDHDRSGSSMDRITTDLYLRVFVAAYMMDRALLRPLSTHLWTWAALA